MEGFKGKYDVGYYDDLVRIQSRLAEEVTKVRWEWILETCQMPRGHRVENVIDYGSGLGHMRVFAPEHVNVFTYEPQLHVPSTGLPGTNVIVDVVTMYDVLEHIPCLWDQTLTAVLSNTRFVVISVPVLPEGEDLYTWHHYKPGEHLHYWCRDSLLKFLRTIRKDVEVKAFGRPECPPRLDIETFTFEMTAK